MLATLADELVSRRPGLEVRFVSGFISRYKPGGLRPRRLLNLVWIYAQAAFHLVRGRTDAVLVRSSPPGIQVWVEWWSRARHIPVICWLMDYHPEIEARYLDRRGLRYLGRVLRAIDSASMQRFTLIVTLDQAMGSVARSRSGPTRVVEHPTWGSADAKHRSFVNYVPGGNTRVVRLAYSGNLGAAHDLETFDRLLEELCRRRQVELFVIGASPKGNDLFQQLGRRLNVPVTLHERVPFGRLQALYEQWQIDAGIVLLANESAGLVSPSKFSGYINFGLPILYLGPDGTNTADVCSRFGGGFWIRGASSSAEISALAAAISDRKSLALAARGARQACAHYAAFNQESMALLLVPYLVPPQPDEAII
jgi:hypothetical protein